MVADTGFDPRRSKVSDSTMDKFMDAPISGLLTQIPGIGEAAAQKLCENEDDPITNSWMLFGLYLKLKGPDVNGHSVDCIEHNDKFWHFLKDVGISSHRSAIVKAIAEKSSKFFDGIYNPSDFDEKK